jgi:hypothetical protein
MEQSMTSIGFLADWLSVVAWGLFLHEMGHILGCWVCRMRVYGVVCSFHPFGVGVRHAAGTPIQNALVSLAGPAMNMLLFAAYARHGDYNNALGNLVFGVFNLILPHSDGWRAVAYLRNREVRA